MTDPISLCVENLEGSDEPLRFIRCVALEGSQAGLAIDERGRPLWRQVQGCACELCVSSDDRLVLLRPKGAVPSRVHRAGRSVDVPENQPVLLLDQDEIEVAGARLRLHVHGPTTEIHEPTPFVPPGRTAVAALAAAVALGAVVTGCDRDGNETGGDSTSIVADSHQTATGQSSSAGSAATVGSVAAPTASTTGETGAPPTTTAPLGTRNGNALSSPTSSVTARPTATNPPIEVRPRPPVAPRRDEPW